ncbi:MAG: hypothetical protein DA407_02580 [Bacteroidetes bacterium]|nr:MAG: hypothetical protein DA407_02580 [Bacteroidota bacterium]
MENKTAKYFRYAIGEILLVMIGILLALQVNNWNENRKKLQSEIMLTEQLLDDARADSVFFESRIWFQQKRDTLFSNLLNLSNGIYVDSITKLKVNADPFFFRLAYQSNLINNNPEAYDLISLETIKNKLRDYIKRHDYIVNAIELNNRIIEEYGVPLKIKYYEQLSKVPEAPLYKDFMFAIEDLETVAQFDIFKSYGINYLIQCQEFLKINQELIQLLESYLKENK